MLQFIGRFCSFHQNILYKCSDPGCFVLDCFLFSNGKFSNNNIFQKSRAIHRNYSSESFFYPDHHGLILINMPFVMLIRTSHLKDNSILFEVRDKNRFNEESCFYENINLLKHFLSKYDLNC